MRFGAKEARRFFWGDGVPLEFWEMRKHSCEVRLLALRPCSPSWWGEGEETGPDSHVLVLAVASSTALGFSCLFTEENHNSHSQGGQEAWAEFILTQ